MTGRTALLSRPVGPDGSGEPSYGTRQTKIDGPLGGFEETQERTMAGRIWTGGAGFCRRDFLRVGSAGLLGLTLADVLRQEAQAAPGKKKAKARGVILLWLGGGPATID